MKIEQIDIHKFRGIVDLSLCFNSENALIVGPNGVGKSAVADAVDFLFTGDVARLTGKGTGDISVIKHGPHVGSPSKDAIVSATIRNDNGDYYKVTRTVSEKDKVSIVPEKYSSEFHSMTAYAKNGAHFLSRRELLKFILVTPTDRAVQIQTLLNLSEIKTIRDAFVKLNKLVGQDIKYLDSQNKAAQADLARQIDARNPNELLHQINRLRQILGGDLVTDITKDDFTKGIVYTQDTTDAEITQLILRLQDFVKYFDEYFLSLTDLNLKLHDLYISISQENVSISEIGSIKLIIDGLALLDGSGKCPLCLYQWKSKDDLREFLLARRDKYQKVSKLIEEFTNLIRDIINFNKQYEDKYNSFSLLLSKYCKDGFDLFEKEIRKGRELYLVQTVSIEQFPSFSKIINKYIKEVDSSLLKHSVSEFVSQLNPMVDQHNKEKTTAWQLLNVAKNYYTQIQDYKSRKLELDRIASKTDFLLRKYDEIQEAKLNGLFTSIKSRFIEFYKSMHGSDEGNFEAKLETSKSGVDLCVDFYAKGQFPPMAYHSEGHQDSMGLALYFALMEKLAYSQNNVIVLDDVVMSVDIDHRRKFCSFIKEYFGNRQFIITTHDEIWARYLRLENVVSSKNFIKFTSWTVDEGPRYNAGVDIWKTCKEMANTGNNGAAAYIRREMEGYFESACGNLRSDVPYNIAHKWDMGDFLFAAQSKLLSAYKWALNHANTNNKKALIPIIQAKVEELKSKMSSLNKELWIENLLVHYNPDYTFSQAELLELVSCLEQFCRCFECPTCSTQLLITYQGKNPEILRCKCGDIMYPLKKP